MAIFQQIYQNLCENKRKNRQFYIKGSGIDCHHIIPKHMGGGDTEDNYTYLSRRDHQIAHYLLWRIYENINDLRSFHMLGGVLTPEMRRLIGVWCYENKVGIFHEKYKECTGEWVRKGIKIQQKNKVGIFDPNKLSYHASLGGKASVKINDEFRYWFSVEGHKHRASLGGKSHKGKKAMYKPGENSFKRVAVGDIDSHLRNGYIFGSPIKPNLGKHQESKKKKKVSDGVNIYDSLHSAAKVCGITPSAIYHRIKSPHFPWCYASDI